MIELEGLGWDNGFGNEKFFTVINSKKYKEEPLTDEEKEQGLTKEEKEQGIKKCRYPSVHMELFGTGAMSNSFTNNFSLHKMNIEFAGKEYLLGEYAIQQDPNGGNRNYDPYKYKHETEIAKLCAGLALMFPDDGKIIIQNLIIGVSLRIYSKAVVKEATAVYKGKVLEVVYPSLLKTGEIRRKKISIEIQNVIVLPQGIGARQDVVIDINGRMKDNYDLLKKRFGVIDIGNNTVDGFIRDGDDPVENSDFYLPHGTSDVYKRVSKQLNMLNKQNKIEMLHIQGKDSIYHNGQDVFFKELVDMEFIRFANEIYQMAYDRWNRFLDSVQVVILAGGCCMYVKIPLENEFKPINILIPSDPQYANASGYYKTGIFVTRN